MFLLLVTNIHHVNGQMIITVAECGGLPRLGLSVAWADEMANGGYPDGAQVYWTTGWYP